MCIVCASADLVFCPMHPAAALPSLFVGASAFSVGAPGNAPIAIALLHSCSFVFGIGGEEPQREEGTKHSVHKVTCLLSENQNKSSTEAVRPGENCYVVQLR